jgi:NAD(P)-dependent dehydrogenase (short-subunit alcohol dehydrogenase family)
MTKVTGTAQGIGRQLALEFWEHGSTVLCVDIDEEGNHVTVRTINAMVSTAATINFSPIS